MQSLMSIKMRSSIKISNLARVLSVSCWCRHTVHHHRCTPGDRRSRQHLSRTLTHWEVHLVHFHFQMSAFLPNCQLLHSCRQQLSCVWSEDPPDGFCFPKQGVGNSKYHKNKTLTSWPRDRPNRSRAPRWQPRPAGCSDPPRGSSWQHGTMETALIIMFITWRGQYCWGRSCILSPHHTSPEWLWSDSLG